MTALPKLTARQRARVLISLGVKKAKGIKPYIPTPKREGGKRTTPKTTRGIPIRCITTGEIFPSITAACYAHHVYPSHLSDHLRGCGYTVGGRTYEYLKPDETPRDLIPPRFHKTAPRAVRCLDDGKEFRSLAACAKHYNISPANLKHHLEGLYAGLNNHRFEWVNPPKTP
jgi:hypothetical protein